MPKKEEKLGIKVKKEEDFSEWYNEVVIKGELADHSMIKGFMIIKPRGYAIWESIQDNFDDRIKKLDFVDEAILGHKDDIFEVLEEFKPGIICLGYDQKTVEEEKLKEELEKRNIKAEIVRANPYKEDIFKSSKL